MPDLSSPDTLPIVQKKVSTIPEPFELSADSRGVKRAEEWACKMQEEMKKQRDMATFHAKPAVVTKTRPFEPKKSTRPVTGKCYKLVNYFNPFMLAIYCYYVTFKNVGPINNSLG